MSSTTAWAAKKYYPPGFVPPSDAILLPGNKTPKTTTPKTAPPPPQVQIIETPGQTIIKTVQVQVPVKAKPPDPLQVLMDDQRYTEALRLVEQRMKQHPGDLGLRLTHADLLRSKGQYDGAESEFRALSRSHDKTVHLKALVGLARTQSRQADNLRRLGEPARAKVDAASAQAVYRQAIKLDPNQSEPWAGLSGIALSEKRLTDAQDAAAKALRIAPNSTNALLAQARVYIAQDRAALALPLIFKAKQQTPKGYQPTLVLGQAYLAMNRYDDAIIQLQQALEIVPDNTEALKSLSLAYSRKLKPDDAESALQKAVTINPNDVEATQALLKVYDDADETERGLLLVKTQLKRSPQQLYYQQALLERSARIGYWREVYRQGQEFLTPLLASPEGNRPVIDGMLVPFCYAVDLQAKGLLDRSTFLATPLFSQILVYERTVVSQTPDAFQPRLNLLLLNPLETLPPLKTPETITTADLPTWAALTFMTGDRADHRKALDQLVSPDSGLTSPQLLETADRLSLLDDYIGARYVIAAVPKNPQTDDKISQLMARINDREQLANRYLQDLQAMSTRVPIGTWKSTASEALKSASGNWRLHAALAEGFWDRRDYNSALIQQRLAALYAPTSEEREHWLKRADKTRQKLNH